jgi:hypothetical protein
LCYRGVYGFGMATGSCIAFEWIPWLFVYIDWYEYILFYNYSTIPPVRDFGSLEMRAQGEGRNLI